MSRKASPQLPVIIGAATVSGAQSLSEAEHNPSDPVDLMARAVEQAVRDSGVLGLLNHVDLTAVVGGLWSYRNPGELVAHRLGVNPGRTLLTDFGGQVPVELCAEIAERIQGGEVEVAVMIGGETNATRRALARSGRQAVRSDDQSASPDEFWGDPLVMGDGAAVDRGGDLPRNAYAVLESALRVRRGESLDEARDRSAKICSAYSQVAATNPHAANGAMSASDIREPSRTNRMVSWPYTKAMCANNTVDHAGAIFMCSHAAADRLGVATAKRVYAHAYSQGRDTATLAERFDVAETPGLRGTCASLAAAIGGIDRVAHFDLYCCYPSMVTLTAEALGISLDRTLTVTGGLGFAGAPINFAAGEGLIGMIEHLRSDPGSIGVVQANGGFASKHAFGAFSSTAPSGDCQILEHGPSGVSRPLAAADACGLAVVDGITVEYGRGGPSRAIALVRYEDGARGWTNSRDHAVMKSATEVEWVGRTVRVADGRFAAT